MRSRFKKSILACIAAFAILAVSEWTVFRLHMGDVSPFGNPDARGDAILRTLPWIAKIDPNRITDAAEFPASLLDWCEQPELGNDAGNPASMSPRETRCRVSRFNPLLDHCWFWWLGRECATVVIPTYWTSNSTRVYDVVSALRDPCRYLRPQLVADKLVSDSIEKARRTLECDHREFQSDLFVVLLEPSFDLGPNKHVWSRVATIHLTSRE